MIIHTFYTIFKHIIYNINQLTNNPHKVCLTFKNISKNIIYDKFIDYDLDLQVYFEVIAYYFGCS